MDLHPRIPDQTTTSDKSNKGTSYGKNPTQVVLNWLIGQENVIPIPGARNAEQAKEFTGAMGWSLHKVEIEELQSMASEIKPVITPPKIIGVKR